MPFGNNPGQYTYPIDPMDSQSTVSTEHPCVKLQDCDQQRLSAVKVGVLSGGGRTMAGRSDLTLPGGEAGLGLPLPPRHWVRELDRGTSGRFGGSSGLAAPCRNRCHAAVAADTLNGDDF